MEVELEVLERGAKRREAGRGQAGSGWDDMCGAGYRNWLGLAELATVMGLGCGRVLALPPRASAAPLRHRHTPVQTGWHLCCFVDLAWLLSRHNH